MKKRVLLYAAAGVIGVLAWSGLRMHGSRQERIGASDLDTGHSQIETPKHLRIVTMNAGLAKGIVGFATARTPQFAADITPYRDADVLCLQEVWQESAVAAVTQALALPPDHVYRIDTRGRNEEPGRYVCDADQLSGILSCVHEKCRNETEEDQTLCALHSCRGKLGALRYFSLDGVRCLNCLAASAGHSIDQVVSDCVSPNGVTRIYGGENGVILASKWPLLKREYLELPSTAVNRVVLFATIQPPGRSPIEVACTHLTSPEDGGVSTVPGFKSMEAEQLAQYRLVTDALRARAGDQTALLVGDLNAGVVRESDGTVRIEGVWTQMLAGGFEDAAGLADPSLCTMCPDNLLRGGDSLRRIDHVLTINASERLAPISVRTILTERHPCAKADGTTVLLEDSDHYGIELFLECR